MGVTFPKQLLEETCNSVRDAEGRFLGLPRPSRQFRPAIHLEVSTPKTPKKQILINPRP